MESVERVVSWCKDVGIEKLTVYDREGARVHSRWKQYLTGESSHCGAGILHDSAIDLQHRLQGSEDSSNSSTESEPEYPLTPPLSDVSESRTLTPDLIPPAIHRHTIHVPPHPPVRKRRDVRNVLTRRRPSSKLVPLYALLLHYLLSLGTDVKSDTNAITLHVISREAGKPAVAKVAQYFLQTQRLSKPVVPNAQDLEYTIEDVGICLEGRPHITSFGRVN